MVLPHVEEFLIKSRPNRFREERDSALCRIETAKRKIKRLKALLPELEEDIARADLALKEWTERHG